jgi:L-ascorbate metabolism protein UlaG (beta-lactamase superfamily)
MPAEPTELSLTFIGTATLLIQCAGHRILTDPNFIHKHEQVSIGYGMHATRLTDPALELAEVLPVDLVVLSHFHGDHFDQVAERELDKDLPIVTTRQAADQLHEKGFRNLLPLDTWEAVEVPGVPGRLRITATPGRHGPAVVDLALPDVMGSILDFELPDGATVRLYLSGDTLVFDDLRELPIRFPDLDVAVLHLGGTRVMGIMVTMDGREGVELMRILEPTVSIPVHYNDYDLFKSPLADFQAEVRAAGLEDRVHYLAHGETFTFGMRSRSTAS